VTSLPDDDPHVLPRDLPVPVDDGAARHLEGAKLPPLELDCTSGETLNLAEVARFRHVLYFFPRTGVPGRPAGPTWDAIPGARGCTPQSLSFRDALPRFQALGVEVFGVSTQTVDHLREFRERERVPFHFLSDSRLELVRALRLPTFEFPGLTGGPSTMLRRMCWFVDTGWLEKLWYPVFPPHENAERVLAWLERRR
jgi:peroxiredoxin